jgi:hypothetical protein
MGEVGMSEAPLLDWGARQRDRGMALAADAQDRARPHFREAALAAIKRVALRQQTVHANDLITEILGEPEHPNCWGHIWREAAANDWIIMTDQTRQCIDPKKHRHRSPVYRSLICGVR